ncbi:MAG: peptidase M23, partial [Melioribacteraceae bacterium]
MQIKKLSEFLKITSILFTILLFLPNCTEQKIETKQVEIKKIIYDDFGFVKDSLKLKTGIVKQNETLADILTKFSLSYQSITEVFNKAKPTFDFRKIRPNKKYFAYFNSDSINSLNTFIYEIDKINYVKVSLTDSIIISRNKKDVSVSEKSISGIINSSLYKTLVEANSSPLLANKLAEVFAWQIDFYTIQKGDEFFAVYNEKYVGDELVDIGDILVAKFIHKGNKYNAFLFNTDNKKEYFDEEGESLQKEFLKAPLKYKRISSRYTGRRLHPILRVYKPHRGIDYAAAIGTHVQAVGDGIVLTRQRKGAAG